MLLPSLLSLLSLLSLASLPPLPCFPPFPLVAWLIDKIPNSSSLFQLPNIKQMQYHQKNIIFTNNY